ncbi:hypothetical protein NOS3756_50000 [Nostoc sp. NIES-3756]|nr:hypothetical protein NOS3756_50000 [Nostoc sp. NIES-3756]
MLQAPQFIDEDKNCIPFFKPPTTLRERYAKSTSATLNNLVG